jgi:hypothetical protein
MRSEKSGLVASGYLQWRQELVSRSRLRFCKIALRTDARSRRIGGTIDEMSRWAAFDPKSRREEEDAFEDVFDDGLQGQFSRWSPGLPASNPFKGLGRNDPCPCGSGKKFKKCCLDKAAA